jgi:type I restriction enzyme S subunit
MKTKTKTTATKEEAKPALLPKLRFPEFRVTEAWRFNSLDSVCEVLNNRRRPITGNERTSGPYPYYGASGVVDYVGDFIFDERLVLVGEDGAKWGAFEKTAFIAEGKFWVNNHAHVLKPFAANDTLLENYLSMLDLSPFVTGAAPPKLTLGKLKRIPIPLPPKPAEQQKIAECLSSVDELMAAQARKLDALKTHKKGLMQQLFPREGETQPRLRFPEFQNAGEWEEEKLDDLLHFQDGFAFKSTDFVKAQEDATQVIRITDINNKNTNEDKVYIPTAFLERNKLSKYRVDDGDLLLSLTGAAGFNFFFWNGGPAAINQRTAKVTSKKKSGDALLRLLEPLIHEKINERGEGQNNNLSKEFLSTIILRVPEPEEQESIATCLSSLDALITAETQKLEALKTHKKGLMQQLFPSPEEVAV